jgi:hypothetical protein
MRGKERVPFVSSRQLSPATDDRLSPFVRETIQSLDRLVSCIAALPRIFDLISDQSTQIFDRIRHRATSLPL